MTINQFGEIVLDEQDLCDLVMQGRDITKTSHVTVDPDFDIERLILTVEDPSALMTWTFPEGSDISIPEFDRRRQELWMMPVEYRDMDIAAYVLGLCETEAQLQRVGQELLMFQERDLFPMLCYLRYLVDVMRENHVIWGVGRGSSVASYVLYLMGVHRIDSLYYDLDPGEFLR
jgi:hypothetical protein